MYDVIAEVADCEQASGIIAAQVRKVCQVAVNQVGDIASIQDLEWGFLGPERSHNFVVATPIVLAQVIGEEPRVNPAGAMRTLEHLRDV